MRGYDLRIGIMPDGECWSVLWLRLSMGSLVAGSLYLAVRLGVVPGGIMARLLLKVWVCVR